VTELLYIVSYLVIFLIVVGAAVYLFLIRQRGSAPEETSRVPDIFRDLDRVAAQEFAFLVDQKGSKPPTVEFWRDYFLVYPIAEDLQVRVGMERGTPDPPFVFIHYNRERLVSFNFSKLLAALVLSVDSSEAQNCARLSQSFSIEEYRRLEGPLASEWPAYLRECARILSDHFDAVIARVRSASQESAAAGIGVVLPEGIPVIGAGAHFIHKRALPIEREDFWRLTDRGFAPSYLPVTCPLCGGTGNMGVRKLKPTSFLAWFMKRPVELFCLKCDQISVAN
jgi:hypothetical protein